MLSFGFNFVLRFELRTPPRFFCFAHYDQHGPFITPKQKRAVSHCDGGTGLLCGTEIDTIVHTEVHKHFVVVAFFSLFNHQFSRRLRQSLENKKSHFNLRSSPGLFYCLISVYMVGFERTTLCTLVDANVGETAQEVCVYCVVWRNKADRIRDTFKETTSAKRLASIFRHPPTSKYTSVISWSDAVARFCGRCAPRANGNLITSWPKFPLSLLLRAFDRRGNSLFWIILQIKLFDLGYSLSVSPCYFILK